MCKPEPHTVVRFKLRSLLAITFGVALVMAVARPYLEQLDAEQQRKFALGTLLQFLIGSAAVLRIVLRRKKSLREAGPVLLSIQMNSNMARQIHRWFALLILLPLAMASTYVTTQLTSSTLLDLIWPLLLVVLPNAMYGWLLGVMLATSWTEGLCEQIHLCDHGVVVGSRLHHWNSPTIRNICVTKLQSELVVNIKGFGKRLPLTEKQHTLARDILAKKYTRPKTPSPFDSSFE